MGYFVWYRCMLLLLLPPLQSCLTLCNPIDGSPPGSAVSGIFQARTLEWVAISFSSAWKWSCSVMPNSSQPHGLQPPRLLRPRDFPGKSTGVGWHCFLWQMYELHLKKAGVFYCCIMVVSVGSTTRGENIACLLLQPLHQPGENKRVCSSCSSSSLRPASELTPCYLQLAPSMNSADSVNSETTGITHRSVIHSPS